MTRSTFYGLFDVLGISEEKSFEVYHTQVAPLDEEGREEFWDYLTSLWEVVQS